MPETPYRLLKTEAAPDALVLTITEPQVEGDEVAHALLGELLAATEAAGASNVIVDFQHVRYISSVAFAPLLKLRRKLQEANGRLVVCGLSSMVGDVFYSTRMISSSGDFTAPFEMQPDVAAARAALSVPLGAADDTSPSP
jgi:anti-anti-sigma factor